MTSSTRNRVRTARISRAERREAARIAQVIADQDALTGGLIARTADALGGYSWGPSVITVAA